MTDNTCKQLYRLKEMLDEGLLSQEEFETLKQRILHSEDKIVETKAEAQETESQQHRSQTKVSSFKVPQKFLWTGISVMAVLAIVLICFISCDNDKLAPAGANPPIQEEDLVTETPYEGEAYYDENVASILLSVEDDEANKTDTQFGAWRKSYFRDDFNEADYSQPYMAMIVPGETSGIKLGILYRPEGSFALKLFDSDGDVRHIPSSEVDFAIRQNGKVLGPFVMKVIKNEMWFIEEDAESMSTIFNNGALAISIGYESYGEDYHYVFKVSQANGSFRGAVNHLLKSTYIGK